MYVNRGIEGVCKGGMLGAKSGNEPLPLTKYHRYGVPQLYEAPAGGILSFADMAMVGCGIV